MGSQKIRMGFHFYHDLEHYTIGQVDQWYQQTGGCSGGFVVLLSPVDRAIPEAILEFFLSREIMPVIQFDYVALQKANHHDVDLLLTHYHHAGIKLLQLAGYINQKDFWKDADNSDSILVQITEAVLWFHKLAVTKGFMHVLPKMVPGGDYWDLIVLEQMLKAIEQGELGISSLVLSFAAWTNDHSLLWGEGGHAKWIQALPYQPKSSGEDHRGLLGFAWYQEIAMKVLGIKLPILLFDGAQRSLDVEADSPEDFVVRFQKICDFVNDPRKQGMFDHVTGICFSFRPGFYGEEVIGTIQRYMPVWKAKKPAEPIEQVIVKQVGKATVEKSKKPIEHYLLLPKYDWGIAKWHLEAALPFIQKYHATVGFSLDEAIQAEKVTVVMDNDVFSDEIIGLLHDRGCQVKVFRGDGTKIAALLAK